MTELNEPCSCPFCKRPSTIVSRTVQNGTFVGCPQCGQYSLALLLENVYLRSDHPAEVEDGHLVSGMIRRQWERRAEEGWETPHFGKTEDFEKIAADAPRRIPDRVRALLENFERATKYVGDIVALPEEALVPLAFAKNWDEVFQFVRYLKDNGWLEGELVLDGGSSVWLTPAGFEELEGRRRSNLDSEKAFVAMWFDKSLDPAWIEGIRPAVKAAGYDPIRIDWDEHNEDINNRIKARIRESRFIVADCTGHRSGVYFEAGFAMGLGLPVIWLCRRDEFGKTHFDTNHYRYTLWDNPADVLKPLEDRIVGTIGRGPLKPKEGVAS